MESQTMPPPRRRWPQFSLRTAFLALLVIATALSISLSVRQYHQIQALREENKRVVNEIREIEIASGNEQKLHAIEVPYPGSEPGRLIWKWRVHVPSKRAFRVEAVVNAIPDSGVEKSGSKLSLPAGESVVTIALGQDERGKWAWILKCNGVLSSTDASVEIAKIMNASVRASCESAPLQSLRVVEPGSDLELLRMRFSPDPSSTVAPDNLKAGPGIWARIREATN